jgi:uncharacterized protein YggT (Ycf19 family)
MSEFFGNLLQWFVNYKNELPIDSWLADLIAPIIDLLRNLSNV